MKDLKEKKIVIRHTYLPPRCRTLQYSRTCMPFSKSLLERSQWRIGQWCGAGVFYKKVQCFLVGIILSSLSLIEYFIFFFFCVFVMWGLGLRTDRVCSFSPSVARIPFLITKSNNYGRFAAIYRAISQALYGNIVTMSRRNTRYKRTLGPCLAAIYKAQANTGTMSRRNPWHKRTLGPCVAATQGTSEHWEQDFHKTWCQRTLGPCLATIQGTSEHWDHVSPQYKVQANTGDLTFTRQGAREHWEHVSQQDKVQGSMYRR